MGNSQAMKSFAGNIEDFDTYAKSNGKPIKCFTLSQAARLPLFLKDHSWLECRNTDWKKARADARIKEAEVGV